MRSRAQATERNGEPKGMVTGSNDFRLEKVGSFLAENRLCGREQRRIKTHFNYSIEVFRGSSCLGYRIFAACRHSNGFTEVNPDQSDAIEFRCRAARCDGKSSSKSTGIWGISAR